MTVRILAKGVGNRIVMGLQVPASSRELWECFRGSEQAGAALANAERNGADLDEAYVTIEDDHIVGIGGWSLESKESA